MDRVHHADMDGDFKPNSNQGSLDPNGYDGSRRARNLDRRLGVYDLLLQRRAEEVDSVVQPRAAWRDVGQRSDLHQEHHRCLPANEDDDQSGIEGDEDQSVAGSSAATSRLGHADGWAG